MPDLYEQMAADYLWAANRMRTTPPMADFYEELASEMLSLSKLAAA